MKYLVLLACLFAPLAMADIVTIKWTYTPNQFVAVKEFRVVWGQCGGPYTRGLSILGPAVRQTNLDIPQGRQFCAVVTAIGVNDVESGASNEVRILKEFTSPAAPAEAATSP